MASIGTFAGLAAAILVALTVAFFGTKHFLVPMFWLWLGNHDTWWSYVRHRPPENQFYIMVKGSPNGPFDSVIESIREDNYDADTDLFRPATSEELLAEDRDDATKIGIAPVGFFKYFLVREFHCHEWDPHQHALVPQKHGTWKGGRPPSYYQKYNIGVAVEAYTVDNFRVTGVLTLTVKIESVKRAFFIAGAWPAKLIPAVQSAFRQHVGRKIITQLREDGEGATLETISTAVKKLSGDSSNEESSLRQLVGVIIMDARFVHYQFIGSDRMMEATQAVGIAELEARARKIKGSGEKEYKQEVAQGIAAEVAAWATNPAVGAAVATAQAIAEAKPSVIGAGVLPTINVGDLDKKKEKE